MARRGGGGGGVWSWYSASGVSVARGGAPWYGTRDEV